MDLRQRIVDAWRAGESKRSLSRRFLVGYATVKRYVRQVQQAGHVGPKPHGGGMPRRVDASGETVLRALLEQTPDLTDAELAQRYRECTGTPVSKASINRALQRMGLTRKKSRSTPASRRASGSRG